MKKRICVILVNYNGVKDTIACIESINQSNDEDHIIDVIVVDNASDNNEGITVKKCYPDITVILEIDNIGFAAANNSGIKKALSLNCDFVLLLNNDTVVSPFLIKRLEKAADPNTVAVPQICYYSDPSKVWYAGGYIDKSNGGGFHYSGTNNKGDMDFATGCCMMLHKSTIEKVGLLDEDYFLYYEDVDYSIRLKQCGIKIKFDSDSIVLHKISASTGGEKSPLTVYYTTRNRLLCINKHRNYFSRTALIKALLSRSIRMIQSAIKKDGNSFYYAYGMLDFLKGRRGKSSLF